MTENGHESQSKNEKYTRQGTGQLQDLLLEKDNTIKDIMKETYDFKYLLSTHYMSAND